MDYRALMRWIRSPPDHKSTTCLNWDLSEMIATVHQGVITVDIKTQGNASGASDRDPTAAVSMRFITHINVASFECSINDRTTAI